MGSCRPSRSGLAEKSPSDTPLTSVHLFAPVPRPGKVFAIGLNYADHIKESGQPTPQHQTWFTKAVTSINGPYDPILVPTASKMIDYEAELVVVIGKRCKHVSKERAAEVVFGYTAGNDVSVRDWQMRSGQWVIGKSFDTHAPIGPWISPPTSWAIRIRSESAVWLTARCGKTGHQEFGLRRVRRDCALDPGDDARAGRYPLHRDAWRSRRSIETAAMAGGRRQGASRDRSNRCARRDDESGSGS